MAPGSTKAGSAGGSRGLADGRKPCLGCSCSRHAATSQPASGQPFSAARVMRDADAHPKQDGAAEEKMAPCLLWERLKDFIALGDNSVSTAICAECLFSLSSTLLLLSHFLCLLLPIREATRHLGSSMSPALAPSAGTGLCSTVGLWSTAALQVLSLLMLISQPC